MKSKPNETVKPEVALRHLADAIGYKWKRMLIEDCSGLGHIHDMWRDMYNDMECIVSLEKFICDNTDGACGVDFLPTIGFPQYKVEKLDIEEVRKV